MTVVYLTIPIRESLQLSHYLISPISYLKILMDIKYKEELKIKYIATTAIAGEFSNGTGFLEYLLAKEAELFELK